MKGVIFLGMLMYSVFITLTYFSREGAEVIKANRVYAAENRADSLQRVVDKQNRELEMRHDEIKKLVKHDSENRKEISRINYRYDKAKMKLDSLQK